MFQQTFSLRLSFGQRVQLAFWLVLLTFNLYIGTFVLGLEGAIFRNLLNFGCHLVNFYAFYSWITPKYYEKKQYLKTFSAVLLIVLVLTPIRFLIEYKFKIGGAAGSENFYSLSRLGFVLFTELTIAGFASLIRLAVDNELGKQRVSELEKLNLQSEIRFLKAQMNPHFLFNTINNIYSLTLLKSDKAPESLLRLSRLLRYLLYESQEKVPLSKELDAIQAYSDLFQLKYENPVNLSINISELKKDYKIEPLILVPILENALKHSGLGFLEQAYVQFGVTEENDWLIVTCSNSRGSKPLDDQPGGIGLDNIKKRMQLAYQEDYNLDIIESPTQFVLTLKFKIA